jgi:hypothetical protein
MVGLNTSPFFIGGPIPTALADTHLHGFEEERRELIQSASRKTPTRIGILGPPGTGKSSLVLAAALQLPVPRAHVDCARIWPSSRTGFYRLLQEALGTVPQELDGPAATVYPNFPQPRKAPHGILVLEDAHRLDDIDPDLLLELPLLAARLPHHICLTGHEAIVGPLCEATISLKPFSEATAADFLHRRFQRAGLRLRDDALAIFYEFTRGIPDTLQRLGHAVWMQARLYDQTDIGAAEVDAAVAELVDRLPTATLTAWAATRGLMRDIFIAMCLHDLNSPTEIARRLRLEPKNVIVLLGRLVAQHDLVDRVERGQYRVRDPLLKHYVRKEWSSPILR